MAAGKSPRSALVTLLIVVMVFSPMLLSCQAARFTSLHGINGVMRLSRRPICPQCLCCDHGPLELGRCCKCC